MNPRTRPRQSAHSEDLKDGTLLAVECIAWLTAWVILPTWLALRGTTITAFTGYAVAAGTILAVGVLADRHRAFEDPRHFLWFAALSSSAILLLGGAVFGMTLLLISSAVH